MKKLLLLTVLATSMTVAVQAQDKTAKTPQERAKARTERMSKELGLTPDQAAKVEAINVKYADKAVDMRTERQAERTEVRKEGMAMRDAHDAEIKAVLTADQYAQWTAKKEEMKERRIEHRKELREKKQ